MTDISDLSEQELWILRLLYAPQNRGQTRSVHGNTRLVKGLFLIERMFFEKFADFEGTGFDFYPHKYGPFDHSIYCSLEDLEEKGLVKIVPTDEYSGDEIKLTIKGESVGGEAWGSLPPDKQLQLSWIKGKHVQQPVAQLLSFVYNRYPKMAERSEYEG